MNTNKRAIIKSFGVSLGLALVLLGALYGLSVLADSEQGGDWPHKFYGDIEIDGAKAPIGVVVEGRGAGVSTGIPGNPITTTEVGKYGGPGLHESKLYVQGDGVSYIDFYVDGVRARCREVDKETGEYIGAWRDNFPYIPEAVTELALAITGEYTLTVNSDGCCPISVTYDTTTTTVAAGMTGAFASITGGTTVTLEAMTDIYCSCSGWEGDLVTTANPVTIPMRSDVTITATCVTLTEHTLTVHETGSGSGTVTREPDQTLYIYGTVVTLTAVPSETAVFGDWSGDLPVELSEINPVTITMDDDKEITATFDFYSVTVSPAADEEPGDPGELVIYMLQAINTGGVADTFDVTAVSSHLWLVIAPQTVEMDAAGAELMLVAVQIPPDAAGVVDVVTVTVTSQGDPRKSATALLTTTATGGQYNIFLPLITKTGATR